LLIYQSIQSIQSIQSVKIYKLISRNEKSDYIFVIIMFRTKYFPGFILLHSNYIILITKNQHIICIIRIYVLHFCYNFLFYWFNFKKNQRLSIKPISTGMLITELVGGQIVLVIFDRK